MITALSVFAAVLGIVLPLAVLGGVVWWRLGRANAERMKQDALRQAAERRVPPKPSGLAWLQDTIGPASPGLWHLRTIDRRCRRCGYQDIEASFFCRRCGARMIGHRSD